MSCNDLEAERRWVVHFSESMVGISGQGRSCGVTLAQEKLSPGPASTWGLWLESKDTSNSHISRLSNDDMLVELILVHVSVSANGRGKDLYRCQSFGAGAACAVYIARLRQDCFFLAA
jgi:hypothetical protein